MYKKNEWLEEKINFFNVKKKNHADTKDEKSVNFKIEKLGILQCYVT